MEKLHQDSELVSYVMQKERFILFLAHILLINVRFSQSLINCPSLFLGILGYKGHLASESRRCFGQWMRKKLETNEQRVSIF